jgi:hypothetical protein
MEVLLRSHKRNSKIQIIIYIVSNCYRKGCGPLNSHNDGFKVSHLPVHFLTST